jgi:hypothetical protein
MVRSSVYAWAAVAGLAATAAWGQGHGMTTGGSSQQPMNVSGKFLMEDGSPPNQKLEIKILCPPNTQTEGTTALDGSFNVELGYARYDGAEDASTSTAASKTGFGGQLSVGRTYQQVDGASVIALIGCFLKADMPGYSSDQYDLGKLRAGDVNTLVGTLFLHPFVSDAAAASATSKEAPKAAQKSLQKGRDAVFKRQYAEGEAELKRAVNAYPQYAEAWNELGGVLEAERKTLEARNAYIEAISCDAKFATPYLNLARLSATEKNWQDAVERSQALAKLNPSAFPQGYYYEAVAEYNLRQYDRSFESALKAVTLDTRHRFPLAEDLLGVLYAERGDYKSAAEEYRNYLRDAPEGAKISGTKSRLAEVEKLLAAEPGK